MPPATRISLLFERNRKGFKMRKKCYERNEKGERKEAIAKGTKGTSTRGRYLLFLFSHFQHVVYPVSTRPNIEYGKSKQYEEGRNSQYLKVSIVRQPSKYLVYQSINSIPTIEIPSISKYQQYTNHRNTQYLKVSIVHQPSKY